MKNLVTLYLLLIGLGAMAQQENHRSKEMYRAMQGLSTQQLASLESKRMTLALNLDSKQQKEIAALFTRHIEERKQMHAIIINGNDSIRPQNAEERFGLMNHRLDRQIAFQRELQGVLTDSQFEMWKEHKGNRPRPRRKGRGHR